MRSKLVRFQLVVFTLVAVLAVGNAAINYLGFKRVTGIGMYSISAEFERAGGLYVNSLVTYLGVDVGVVKTIELGPDRATAQLQIDSDFQIPKDSRAYVRSVSAIGEQYLDLVPNTSDGPFLEDHDVITKENTDVPVPTADVVDKVNVATRKALEDPAVRKRIEDTGSVVLGNTPEQFAQQMKDELAVYRKVVESARLKLE